MTSKLSNVEIMVVMEVVVVVVETASAEDQQAMASIHKDEISKMGLDEMHEM